MAWFSFRERSFKVLGNTSGARGRRLSPKRVVVVWNTGRRRLGNYTSHYTASTRKTTECGAGLHRFVGDLGEAFLPGFVETLGGDVTCLPIGRRNARFDPGVRFGLDLGRPVVCGPDRHQEGTQAVVVGTVGGFGGHLDRVLLGVGHFFDEMPGMDRDAAAIDMPTSANPEIAHRFRGGGPAEGVGGFGGVGVEVLPDEMVRVAVLVDHFAQGEQARPWVDLDDAEALLVFILARVETA